MTISYFELLVGGIFTGVGAALGTYLANRYFVKRTGKIINEIKDRVENIEKGVENKIKKSL